MLSDQTDDRFIQFRRELHRFPEVSGQEIGTQQRIKTFVNQFRPVSIQEVGATGLLVQYGQDETGPVTLIRADIDALPIQEVNTFAHRSVIDGVSHKCGHDGHAAIVARLASLLAQKRVAKGRVYLVFQPAEENGQGAQAVLSDPALTSIRPDRVFALHNVPGYPQGLILCKPGPFTPSVLSMVIRFTGYVAHASEPENGLNPAYVMADFLLKSKALQITDPQSETFTLITPVYTTMGEKSYGVSAGYGEVHVTLRTRTASRMEALTMQLQAILMELSDETGIAVETAYTDAFFASENDGEAFGQVRQSALKLGYAFVEKQEPFKWGEDFGLFTQKYKGAMFGIGAGESTPALHNDDYDFNDALIEPAARLFLELIALQHA